jgi:hypothetical protein
MADERRLTVFSLTNSLLCSVMAVCLAAAAGRLIELIGSSWLGDLFSIRNGLIVGFFLVSLEVQWSRRLMAPRAFLSLDWWKATVGEWFFLLLGLWALIWLVEGPAFALEDLRALSNWNFTGLIRAEHMAGLTLLVLVWGFNQYLVGDLMPLENISLPRSNEGLRDTEKAQSAARNRLWQDVFVFGGLMVLLSLVGAAVVRMIWNTPADIGPVGMETLVYFFCGLGLFAIGRLMVLRVDWALDRTRPDAGIPRRWMIYSLGFILILIFLASALPTEYSLNLLTSLSLAIQGISSILFVLWALIVFPVMLLVSSLFSFLLGSPRSAQVQPAEKPIADVLPALPAGVTWVTVLREIFFWVIAVLVLIYILRQILKFRLTILRAVRHWAILVWILDRLRGWEKRLAFWRKAVSRAVQNSLLSLREDFTRRTGWEPLGFVNLRSLTPRQSIRFYFFALLRRGAEQGAVRRPAQTPREYAAGLTATEESIGGELREMTLAFEEARYTSHEIGPDKARRVRKVWNTIRSKMRRFGSKAEKGGKVES